MKLKRTQNEIENIGNRNIVHTHEALNFHWRVWRWTGIHLPPNIHPSLYFLYSIWLNFTVTLIFPLTLVANLFFAINMQQLCENLTITVTDIVANIKFVNVFFVRSELLSIKPILRRLDQRATTDKEREILRSAIRTAHRSFRIFALIYTVGTILSIIKVVLAKERKLVYPAWFYVDWKSSMTTFLLVNIYQVFGLIVQAIQDCANDSYPPAYLSVLAAHMEALAARVRSIGATASVDSEQFRKNRSFEEENYHKLTACIKDYLDILDLHAIIQYALSKTCLTQFVGSAFVQGTVAIHFLYVMDAKDLSAQMLSIIFFAAVTLEMFLLCYFAHHMQGKSEDLSIAFYSCEWISQLPKFKQNLLITLVRVQQPCTIKAGRYFKVDLPTFLLIVKYSYSFFTLLLRFK